MKTEERNLVSYFDLSEAWQAEARSNNDDYEGPMYIEPLAHHVPETHYLLDLSECMRCDNPNFDGIITISNNSGIGVKLIDAHTCILTYL